MRSTLELLRRLAYPALLYGILAGLWVCAATDAQRQSYQAQSDEFAQPVMNPVSEVNQKYELVADDSGHLGWREAM